MNTAKLKAAAERVVDAYGDEWFEAGRQICTVHKSKIHLISLSSPENILELIAALEAAQPQTAAARDVLEERQRQILTEGWTPEHDDDHTDGSLAAAAGSYALHAAASAWGGVSYALPASWPWSVTWWKPKNPRADLVKAGALILAEIERIDRAAMRTPPAREAPVTVEIDWLDDCPKCGNKKALVTGRLTTAQQLWTGDAIICPNCGNEGEIDADGKNALAEWGE
ncbi:hypothetical protein [Cronobacter dublinensis]|uniref:hypothetical protein n=1 Tax=Cronobacter dublinensis TaxID=413497 RepID=UPI001F3B99F2|nr:hypothetical protein [Cronobacter dublinensis]